jgi:cell pole-organizing protein PopZ
MSEAENGEQAEPTMEEILASIRRIISEDEVEEDGGGNDDGAADAPEAVDMDDLGDFDTDKLDAGADVNEAVEKAPEEAPEEAVEEDMGQDDIDALMNAVDDTPEITELPDAEEDVLELTEVVEEPVSDLDTPVEDYGEDEIDVFDAQPEPEPAPVPPAVVQSDSGPGLISDNPAGQTSATFSHYTDALAMARGVPIGNPNKSVEDIVKELLRPMLREWLDDNLPALVERLVEREINKLAGQGEKD